MRLPSFHLIYSLSVRQLHEESKASFLGGVWLLLKPLIQLAIYVVVFGVIFAGRFRAVADETKMEYALGVFLGMIFVQLVTEPLQSAAFLMPQYAGMVKKNAFPLLALPLSRTLAQVGRGLASMLLWAAAALFIVPERAEMLLLIPLLIFPLFLLALGLNAGIAALSVFVGDIGQAVQMLSQIVFWSSGVFYGRVLVAKEPVVEAVLRWNPVFEMVEESRSLLLWGLPVHWEAIAISYAIGALVCVLGCGLFQVLRRGMADFI